MPDCLRWRFGIAIGIGILTSHLCSCSLAWGHFLPARRRVEVGRKTLDKDATSGVASVAAANTERCGEWQQELFRIWGSVVALWTGLDCVLDPGVRPEDPAALLKIALPTAFLVAPGAAVAACARLKPKPIGLEEGMDSAAVVFVGDSLTQGTVSANVVEVLADRCKRRQQHLGDFVNAGLNFRALEDVVTDPPAELMKTAAKIRCSHGLVLQLGSNDLIRYLSVPELLRPTEEEWLQNYAKLMHQAATQLGCNGGKVFLVSPPPLGEALSSPEFRLGAEMARRIELVATELGCSYVPLYEACVAYLAAGQKDPTTASRYSLMDFLPGLCVLPWRLYAARQSLSQIQEEQGLDLTVDLVHFGHCYAKLAADVLEQKLGLAESKP
ncbi:unnamed protein product [Cladocopium goreaui]|uniref:SGNH hydrolase-type esterase domain-containing protein n=1 Tax=Cladocopium goreaui TaxID=2562237 RepID=A0A9P1FVB2_9DINO|nr:unnamed protein product [Cladocopium goreaui]